MKKVVIFGATSAIAQATARKYARKGGRLYLLARDRNRLEIVAQGLREAGASEVHTAYFEASDIDAQTQAIDTAIDGLSGFDVALLAYGVLPDQRESEASVALALESLGVNAFSVIALLTRLANACERQRYGTLAVLTCIDGDRGRQSNYVHGAGQAALGVFLQGLRNRLYHCGAHVVTIKTGFVDTPMMATRPKGKLWSTPERVADGVLRAIDGKRNVAYVPGWWAPIMWLVKAVPEAWFKRLTL
ncbi:SDR family NAD(P)-dependent oxidoreductase [Verticiella sediminum]|uniref:SDR family NAD(P)-dependent oxidoreductase n=1 Tax=Verticiella sediminum TaxID=1247510 RepID=A0A556B058_9BURK|nr:SDR family NAD(P)-dependent oxidoreductase [Verticiella sediminum]TSH98568.1 SDR family NAD(P)-dependent oxidoreductase [Verticiella sediminum]